MAIMDVITNNMIENAINAISSKTFSTLHVLEVLIDQENEAVGELRTWSSRNWKALIGELSRGSQPRRLKSIKFHLQKNHQQGGERDNSG